MCANYSSHVGYEYQSWQFAARVKFVQAILLPIIKSLASACINDFMQLQLYNIIRPVASSSQALWFENLQGFYYV